ncbi:MAG: substrate-binding domain-containing protein [Candidatus Omnitrophica bacterium]|nr:substrate-binding domain-containing protein [Candidatus Omnitrophota bacterium]
MAKRSVGLVTSFTPEIFKCEYFTRIISGIIDALRNTSFDLRFIMLNPEDRQDPKRTLQEHQIEGLMFLTWTIHKPFLEEAKRSFEKLPIVLINDFTPEVETSIVHCNNAAGTRKALQYLIGRGYRKIGMLQAPDEDSKDAQARYKIYREMLEAAGLEFNPNYFKKCDYFFEEDGYLKMLDLIHHSPALPRAVFCFNDDLAIGALRALKEEKISCPEQVAVIGYDGLERGKYVNPPLTSVRQPLEAMGREMVRILIQILDGETHLPIQKEFQPDLIIRRSVV